MKKNLSPKYVLDIINKISDKLFEIYQTYKRVEQYLIRWQKIIDFEYDEYEKYPVYNFNLIYKDKDRTQIAVIETLNHAPDELVMQIAIDLDIEVSGIIYSIAKIEGLDKNNYKNARIILDDAIKRVYEKPNEAIGLANSALESIIKHILEEGKIDINYNKNDTLYQLSQKILKGFGYFPSKDTKNEICKIGSSFLTIVQTIESLRSEKTNFHGKDSSQYVINDPLYACFIVNSVATLGHFLMSFYEKKFVNEMEVLTDSNSNQIEDFGEYDYDDLPF